MLRELDTAQQYAAAGALLAFLLACSIVFLGFRWHGRAKPSSRGKAHDDAVDSAATTATDVLCAAVQSLSDSDGEDDFPLQRQQPPQPAECASLSVTNYVRDASPVNIPYNQRAAVEYDSPYVSGNVLLLFRTETMEAPLAAVFAGKKRYFEFRFSLLIKQTPKGVLVLGGELPGIMKLGFAADLMCRAILSVLRQLSSSLHAGFGDAKTCETAHICFPLWYAAERLVVTKAGAGPPPDISKLAVIPESDESRAARLKDASFGSKVLVAGSIVTFSLHSAYLDFARWKLRGLPGIKNQSLRLFWDERPLIIALSDVVHLRQPYVPPNRTHWAALLAAHGPAPGEAAQLVPNTPLSSHGAAAAFSAPGTEPFQLGRVDAGDGDDANGDDDDDNGGDDDGGDDDGVNMLSPTRRRHMSWPAVGLKPFLFRGAALRVMRRTGVLLRVPAVVNDDAFVLQSCTQAGVESFECIALAPMVAAACKLVGFSGERPALRCLHDALAWRRLLDAHLRTLGFDALSALPIGRPLLASLSTKRASTSPRPFSRRRSDGATLVHETAVLRAVTEELWIEERAVLGWLGEGRCRLLLFAGESKMATRVICVDARLAVTRTPGKRLGMAGLVLATVMREDVLLLDRTDELAGLLAECQGAAQVDGETAFVDDTMRWGAQRRIVLNTRELLWGPRAALASDVEAYVARLLRLAATIGAEDASRVDFLHCASGLRALDFERFAATASDAASIAVFLNLYHAMLLHARWLVGPPATMLRWGAFGTQASYEVGWGGGKASTSSGGFPELAVLSLAEMEHCVLRDSWPRLFADIRGGVQAKPVPSSVFTEALKLKTYDARVNFALNHGCMAELDFVPVYASATLEKQLQAVAAHALDNGVVVKEGRIKLPRIVYWFFADFTKSADAAHGNKLVQACLPMMSDALRARVLAANPSKCVVRFAKFKWEPRETLEVRAVPL